MDETLSAVSTERHRNGKKEHSMTASIRIERTRSPSGKSGHPYCDPVKGYELGDPRHGKVKHHRAHAVFVATLEEAADLIERLGFSIRMVSGPARPSLVSPRSLRIVRT